MKIKAWAYCQSRFRKVKPNNFHFVICKVVSIGFYPPFGHYCTFQQCISCEIGKSQYNVLLFKSLIYDSWLLMSKTSYWDCLLTGYLQYSAIASRVTLRTKISSLIVKVNICFKITFRLFCVVCLALSQLSCQLCLS